MDPKGCKPHSKRVGQDPEHPSARRSNRLFLSETIPPSHQSQPAQSRSHNLSGRIHDYYEKLVKSSQLKNPSSSSQSHQLSAGKLEDPYLDDRSTVTVPRYGEQLHQPVPISNATQPGTHNVRQPYTVYVEDPAGAFQRYNKKKPSPAHGAGPSFSDTSDIKTDVSAQDNSSTRVVRERSKSPSVNRIQCALCHSSSHSSQNCSLQSRVPAEHDGFFSHPLHSGGSPPVRQTKAGHENQGDGSEDKQAIHSISNKKRSIPPNINVRCERDVIGQEKSPVSKSHPVGSAALSTSSSNGDTVPRERKKWVRPPLVGQAASAAEKPSFMNFDCLDPGHSLEKTKTSNDGLQLSSSTGSDQTDTRFSHPKSSYFDPSITVSQNNDDFYAAADRDVSSASACQQLTSEGEQGLSDSCAGGRVSPSSSVTSNRRLEWDSGADVGYNQIYGSPNPGVLSSGLCTIERMALAQGCSAALHLRLDPEGTTVPASPTTAPATVLPSPLPDRPTQCPVGKPAAESTPVDQLPYVTKALLRYQNDPKSVISPIFHSSRKNPADQKVLSKLLREEVGLEEAEDDDEGGDEKDAGKALENKQVSKSPDVQGSSNASTIPFHRQLSNSMQDLRKCSNKLPENQLLKSQSDPDISGDLPAAVSKSVQCKILKEIPRGRNLAESRVTGHSISSGSDATLVHVGTEEDIAVDADNDSGEHHVASTNKEVPEDLKSSSVAPDFLSLSMSISESGTVCAQPEQENCSKSSEVQPVPEKEKTKEAPAPLKQTKACSKAHPCSDSDHKRGLHHHFGVLCSTVLGGHIQSSQANAGTQLQNVVQGPDRVYAACDNQNKQQSRESTQSPPQDSEVFTGESTGSSAFHSDAAHEENAPCTSTLTGRANSFEYLPGHVYENKSAPGLKKHERPPGISTSTETDSEPARPVSRVMHRKVVESSSHDTEDDRLWSSPRGGSNTLVQDLERGVHLLKGVVENKSAGRRCKRELIRRIIKKLVTSEYVEDMIEKERFRHQAHSPFSPRRTKYQERQDKNLRSKRTLGHERQEISGESDVPRQRNPNVRRKLTSYQPVHHSQGPRTLSTLASGSKSSSLWSSHADSTSGSISLSGSSDNQNKESKISVKTNPIYKSPQEKSADWLKPTTQSEKLFEMRKNGALYDEKQLAGLVGTHSKDPALDPAVLKNDPQNQLSWVTNEINHLKILKQLLQKQEYLKQSLDPNSCQTNFTTMPLTGVKQTMQMADCTSPDIPESHSPTLQPSRRHPWISLESDTSAGFGLSNNTESSRDSHWQEVEVASAGEQDGRPHRTVSISDGDQMTDASCSLSNRKSDVSQSSGPQVVPKPRRRSVSISDTDQQLGAPHALDAPIQRKRSDCHCGSSDGKANSARPAQVGTYGPPSRNLVSEKFLNQICERCTSHTRLTRRSPPASGGGLKSSLTNRIGGSLGLPRPNSNAQQLEDGSKKSQSCSCGPAKNNKCCCSTEQSVAAQLHNIGAVKKRSSGSSSQLFSRVVAELPSTSTQPLSGGGKVRVHIETEHDLESESHQGSMSTDRAEGAQIAQPTSDDSLTKAVTQAVSSKVKALRNLGQIEEAEVKIRVKVTPGQGSDSINLHCERGRVLKTQDLDDESTFHPSKQSEMDEMIARQRAMDYETRQKLLAIAESRQRAEMGLHDIDRRIQDILLQDYLSRQFKAPEPSSTPHGAPHGTPHARLNVRVETPVLQGSSIGVQSDVDRKTIGTSTAAYLDRSPLRKDDQCCGNPIPLAPQQPRSLSSSRGGCICGGAPVEQPLPVMNRGQQTQTAPCAQPAPASYLCSCRSQAASSPRTYHASPPFSSPERLVEFELDLRKQRPCKLTPHDVHETLKSRNTAYFLQFEEDAAIKAEPSVEDSKPPMEVVTMKIPMQKPSGVKPTLSSESRKSSPKTKAARSSVPGAPLFRASSARTSSRAPQARSPPAGAPHNGTAYSGAPYSGAPYSGAAYSGAPYSGAPYSGAPNSGAPNSGAPNSGAPNSGAPNSGAPYNGAPYSGAPYSGATYTGATYAGGQPAGVHYAAGSSQSQTQLPAFSTNQGLLSGSESPSYAANLLRTTPGRSHLSISITDSSPESVHSPEGDSRYSSSHHPARKPHRSPRHNRERGRKGGRGKGDVSQTLVFRTDGSKSPSSTMSAQDQKSKLPANESESFHDENGDDPSALPTLQEYLEKNHPKYLDAAEKRRRCIAEMTYLRRLRQQSRKRLLELEGDNMYAKQKQQWRMRCASRPRPVPKKRPMPKSTKSAYTRRYMFSPENQHRLAELKQREEKRTNRLMAEIYTRKLQEKVLRGSATIRSSVSVLSSL